MSGESGAWDGPRPKTGPVETPKVSEAEKQATRKRGLNPPQAKDPSLGPRTAHRRKDPADKNRDQAPAGR